jgi:hypothetical protein
MGANDCLTLAFTWASERHYFKEKGNDVWASIKENGWKILLGAAGMFGVVAAAQFVPVLNVALDIVLIIEFGYDVLSTLYHLIGALKAASSANSVLEMQRASAQLAEVLVDTGAKILLWAIAWAGGKIVDRAVRYRQGKKFIDQHGDTPDVRKALGDARGDIARAERNLAQSAPLGHSGRKQHLPPRMLNLPSLHSLLPQTRRGRRLGRVRRRLPLRSPPAHWPRLNRILRTGGSRPPIPVALAAANGSVLMLQSE